MNAYYMYCKYYQYFSKFNNIKYAFLNDQEYYEYHLLLQFIQDRRYNYNILPLSILYYTIKAP